MHLGVTVHGRPAVERQSAAVRQRARFTLRPVQPLHRLTVVPRPLAAARRTLDVGDVLAAARAAAWTAAQALCAPQSQPQVTLDPRPEAKRATSWMSHANVSPLSELWGS